MGSLQCALWINAASGHALHVFNWAYACPLVLDHVPTEVTALLMCTLVNQASGFSVQTIST